MAEEVLHLTMELPHCWERLSLPDDAMERFWQHDLMVLRVLNDLEGHMHREPEAQPGQGRLEAKLDLALHLLAQALYGKTPPPSPGPITLSSKGVGLAAGEPMHPGEHLIITLYPSTALLLPLRMPAQVLEGSTGQIRLDWIGMPEACRDALEQWLFRQHRRWVHGQRSRK